MGQASLYCDKCGFPCPLDEVGDLSPCVVCGNFIFVPLSYLSWEARLTEKDKEFLRTNKIGLT